MNRLWVRLSIFISSLLTGIIVLVVAVILFLSWVGVGTPLDETSGQGIYADILGEPDGGPIWLEIPQEILTIAAIASIFGIAIGILVSRILSSPIARLAEAARAIGDGDLSTRVDIHNSQELADLAHAFNKMATDLQKAEQLRSNLMADVSHELRTPLSALEGNLRAALDRVYELDEAEIANLYGQTLHLIRLVNDLRELAQAEAHQLPLDKQETDLSQIITETIHTFQPLAEEKQVELGLQISDKLPSMTLDTSRIRQVLHNLLSNALRYTPNGGAVMVSTSIQKKEIGIIITDSGEGISQKDVPHIFDRFFRTDQSRSRETGGTGLGLAIVKAITEAHGGRVQVNSEGLNQGSQFSIYLPS